MPVEHDRKIVGEALRFLRRQKGLTQEDISKQIGVKRPTYSAWEQGKTSPSVKILEAIARIYEVSADDITTGKYTPQVTEHLSPYSTETHALATIGALRLLEDHDPEKTDRITELMADTLAGIALLVYRDDAFPRVHSVMLRAVLLAERRLLDRYIKERESN